MDDVDLVRLRIPTAMRERTVAWLVELEGVIVDARMLPADLQDEARWVARSAEPTPSSDIGSAST